jgi:hypothetical protein
MELGVFGDSALYEILDVESSQLGSHDTGSRRADKLHAVVGLWGLVAISLVDDTLHGPPIWCLDISDCASVVVRKGKGSLAFTRVFLFATVLDRVYCVMGHLVLPVSVDPD